MINKPPNDYIWALLSEGSSVEKLCTTGSNIKCKNEGKKT